MFITIDKEELEQIVKKHIESMGYKPIGKVGIFWDRSAANIDEVEIEVDNGISEGI